MITLRDRGLQLAASCFGPQQIAANCSPGARAIPLLAAVNGIGTCAVGASAARTRDADLILRQTPAVVGQVRHGHPRRMDDLERGESRL